MLRSVITPAAVTAIINTAPRIMETARKFYSDLSERHRVHDSVTADADTETPSAGSERLAELEQRLATLESDEAVQAELVSQMAAQEEALSVGLRAVSARVVVLLWVSVGAVLAAPAAIVIAFQ